VKLVVILGYNLLLLRHEDGGCTDGEDALSVGSQYIDEGDKEFIGVFGL
jgi:hypothetical protein